MITASSPRNWLPAVSLLLMGNLGCAAAWILLGHYLDSLCSPMAVLAALDAGLLLHLAGLRRGKWRAMLALVLTSTTALLAMGSLVSARIGQQLGFSWWEALQRLGFEPARLIVQLSLDRVDLAWLLAGLVIAVMLSR